MTDKELLELAAKAAGIGEYIGMCADAYRVPDMWNPSQTMVTRCG